MTTYYQRNKERILIQQAIYRASKKEAIAAYKASYRVNNKEHVLARDARYRITNSEAILASQAKHRSANTDKRAEYVKHRLTNDLEFKISRYLRSRLYGAVKKSSKTGSAVRDLGCSISEFKSYIENKFTEGMTWDNHGDWHLDHIIPLSSFDLTIREELLQACNYTNYQPLWAVDNLRKSDKLTYSIAPCSGEI